MSSMCTFLKPLLIDPQYLHAKQFDTILLIMIKCSSEAGSLIKCCTYIRSIPKLLMVNMRQQYNICIHMCVHLAIRTLCVRELWQSFKRFEYNSKRIFTPCSTSTYVRHVQCTGQH